MLVRLCSWCLDEPAPRWWRRLRAFLGLTFERTLRIATSHGICSRHLRAFQAIREAVGR